LAVEPAGPRRQPTLDTVAAEAGVSRATVSRVINDSPLVSSKIRDTVEKAIARLGYVPNRAARSLVMRRTDSVALVMREPDATVLADPYLANIIIATSQALVGTGVQLVLMNAQNDAEHAQLADYVRGGHFDGVLLASMHGDDPLPEILVRSGVPTVVGGRPATADDRLAGYRRALPGSPTLVERGEFTRESGERAMAELLGRSPDLDGVFVANDLMAIGALRALRAAGRRVPDDVAVVGFDDIELAKHTEPPLTTVHQPVIEQARTMTELLLTQIGGTPAPAPVVLPTHLVERAST
jgi:DNA-binding LacI/PurR family transcriptional regulator